MAKPKDPKKADLMAATRSVDATVKEKGTNGNGVELNGAAKGVVRKRTSAMPEIVKSDTRATLVPINLEEEIRRLAYLMAERRGFEPGHEADDWFAAEREVRQRYHQHSA